jgi:hypothetical protein
MTTVNEPPLVPDALYVCALNAWEQRPVEVVTSASTISVAQLQQLQHKCNRAKDYLVDCCHRRLSRQLGQQIDLTTQNITQMKKLQQLHQTIQLSLLSADYHQARADAQLQWSPDNYLRLRTPNSDS